MGVMTISISDETEEKFRKLARDERGGKKGYLGDAITEAIESWVESRENKNQLLKLAELMDSGFKSGSKPYRTRDEIYDRKGTH